MAPSLATAMEFGVAAKPKASNVLNAAVDKAIEIDLLIEMWDGVEWESS